MKSGSDTGAMRLPGHRHKDHAAVHGADISAEACMAGPGHPPHRLDITSSRLTMWGCRICSRRLAGACDAAAAEGKSGSGCPPFSTRMLCRSDCGCSQYTEVVETAPIPPHSTHLLQNGDLPLDLLRHAAADELLLVQNLWRGSIKRCSTKHSIKMPICLAL